MLPMEREMYYAGWRIDPATMTAFKVMDDQTEWVVPLRPFGNPPPLYEGWLRCPPFPPVGVIPSEEATFSFPSEDIDVVVGVGGSCLFGATCALHFPEDIGTKKRTPPKPKSLVLPLERPKAYEYAEKYGVEKISVPRRLSKKYHMALINWQRMKIEEIIKRRQPKRCILLYHVPGTEYRRSYFRQLDEVLGKRISLLYKELNLFVRHMWLEILATFPREVEIVFIEPTLEGLATSPEEAFAFPYYNLEHYLDDFAVDPLSQRVIVVSLEDLVELRTVHAGLKRRLKEGKTIYPMEMLATVLCLPHPYFAKEPEEGEEIVWIEV